jgi:hypothetical protein
MSFFVGANLAFLLGQSNVASQLFPPWTGLQRNLTGAGISSKPVSRFPKGLTRPPRKGFAYLPSKESPSRQFSPKR